MVPLLPTSRMSRVRFQASGIDLELSGSEPFVLRQLKLLASFLGGVDEQALGEEMPARPSGEVAATPEPPDEAPVPVAEASPTLPLPVASEHAGAPTNGGPVARPWNGGAEAPDELLRFYGEFQPQGLDRQSDAALLFAYYLQRREGMPALQLGDLIRCCIRAGVDTRNFNRTLGILTRRGYLETVRHGHAYRLSEHGVAAVESRM